MSKARYMASVESLRIGVLLTITSLSIASIFSFKRHPVAVGIAAFVGSIAGTAALVDSIYPDDRDLQYQVQSLLDKAKHQYYLQHPLEFKPGANPPKEFVEQFVQESVTTASPHPATALETAWQAPSTPSFVQPTTSHKTATEHDWVDTLINPSVLLVFGADGSGKTTFAFELIRRRIESGHDVVVLDPHNEKGKWGSLPVIGGGNDHKAIEQELYALERLCKERYALLNTGQCTPNDFQHKTYVVEEMTAYASKVKNASSLLTNIGDYRKLKIHVLMVAHGDKLGQLGGAKGFADTINSMLSKVYLGGTVGKDGEPCPTFTGWYMHRQSDKVQVKIPKLSVKASDLRLPLKEVNHQIAFPRVETISQQGKTFTYPSLHDVLASEQFCHIAGVVHQAALAGGEVKSSYLAQYVAPINSDLQHDDGQPFNGEDIRLCFTFLVTHYPAYFQQSHPKHLTVKGQAISWLQQEFKIGV